MALSDDHTKYEIVSAKMRVRASVDELKKRLKNLPHRHFSFRDDPKTIKESENSRLLTFHIWRMMENRPNCRSGEHYTFHLGKRYITIKVTEYFTGHPGVEYEISITPEHLEIILSMIEAAYVDFDEPVDLHSQLKAVANRVKIHGRNKR